MLCFSSNNILHEYNDLLILNKIVSAKLIESQFNFYSRYQYLETKALITFALGSKVYKGEIKGVIISIIDNFLDWKDINKVNKLLKE